MKKLKEKFEILVRKGLFHIFGSNVVNSAIAFVTNILIVNFLTKTEYGIFSYANNALSIFSLATGLGLNSGLLQYCSEKRDEAEKASFFKWGFKIAFGFNILLGGAIWLYGKYADVAIQESARYIQMLMFLPVLEIIYNLISIILRTKKENIKYAKLLNFNTITYSVLSCIGAGIGGIHGTIIGRYISFVCSIVVGCYMCKNEMKAIRAAKKIERDKRLSLLKYSGICCASNSISQLLYLLDVFLIGVFIIDSSVIASYKVATLIPTALTFIPSGVMVFIYPYFAENNKNIVWIKEKMALLFKTLAVLNAFISMGLFIFAPLIIKILWGDDYMDSLIPFRILAINYFFTATVRIPCGNILAMLRMVKVNLVVSIISGLANVVLDIMLIKIAGSNGAALATLFVVLISSIIMGSYLLIILNKKDKWKDSVLC